MQKLLKDQTMNEGEESKTAQILVRIAEEERDEWKRAAEALGVSMSDMIRSSVAPTVKEALYCIHPLEFRRTYPWAEFCDNCGERLSG
jgi:pyrroloquinoline quinone (PQQ) biosynthesis protein C